MIHGEMPHEHEDSSFCHVGEDSWHPAGGPILTSAAAAAP